MKKLIIESMNFKFHKNQDYFFHNVSITFESGKIYFIQGKNGVGKSTFFSILQGNISHNAILSGRILLDQKKYVIRNNIIDTDLYSFIQTMVQDVNKMIINSMTVAENLLLAQLPSYPGLSLMKRNNPSKKIDAFHINVEDPVYKLSGGQKQILAIIMMLQKPTKILLLDEPTAALDDKNSKMIMEFLNILVKELDLIIIIITHDKELITTYNYHEKITIQKRENETRVFS